MKKRKGLSLTNTESKSKKSSVYATAKKSDAADRSCTPPHSSRLPSKQTRACSLSNKSAQGTRVSVREKLKKKPLVKKVRRSEEIGKHDAASPLQSTHLHKASPPAGGKENPPSTNSNPPPASDSSDSLGAMEGRRLLHGELNGKNMRDSCKPSIEPGPADRLLMLAQFAESPTMRPSPLSFSCIYTRGCAEEKPDTQQSAKSDVPPTETCRGLANSTKPLLPDSTNSKEDAVECHEQVIRNTSLENIECRSSLSFSSLMRGHSDGISSSQDKDNASPEQDQDDISSCQETVDRYSFHVNDEGASSKDELDGSSNQDKLGDSTSQERVEGSSLITIMGCQLELEYARAAQTIVVNHGDILANCLLEGSLRSHLFRSASSIYMKLERLNFTAITVTELDSMRIDVHDLEKANVDISWLANKLDAIRVAKQMEESNTLSNIEEQLMQNQKNVKCLLKQLRLQRAKFEGIKSKLEAEKAQTAALRETFLEAKEKVLPFTKKSLVDGI